MIDVEQLSARLHEIYQAEAHRRGDVRHADAYADLPELTKEWDRVLARWILAHWQPAFDVSHGLPPAVGEPPGEEDRIAEAMRQAKAHPGEVVTVDGEG